MTYGLKLGLFLGQKKFTINLSASDTCGPKTGALHKGSYIRGHFMILATPELLLHASQQLEVMTPGTKNITHRPLNAEPGQVQQVQSKVRSFQWLSKAAIRPDRRQ